MKKAALISLSVLLVGLAPYAQEQHEVTVLNIEIPVRVMDGKNFVKDLNAQDFEIYEDGELQKIGAFYLVHNTKLEKQEASSWSSPNTSRRFYMLFQFLDYNPQMEQAIGYFFNTVMQPNDTLTVMTPLKRYDLSREALKNQPPEKLSRDLQSVVRRDTKIGAGDYNSAISELKKIVRSISSAAGGGSAMSGIESTDTGSDFGLELNLPRYKETLQRLDELRIVNEQKFFSFAAQMKRQPGQKVVFMFYQREFRPEIESSILNRLVSMYQDQPNILSAVQDLFSMYSRDVQMNVKRLSQAYSDASIMFNFIFMHKEPENVRGINMREQSEDIFNTFAEVAQATGGIVDSSQNPSSGFRAAADACSDYYLLIYNPANYAGDGKFKNITVKVKGKEYKLIHRTGYIAN